MDTRDIKAQAYTTKPPKLLKTAGIICLVIVACGLSFAGGIAYQKKQPVAQTNNGGLSGLQGAMGGGPGGMRQNGTFGTVTAITATNISIQDSRAGTTTTLTIDSSTVVNNNGTTATASDIKVGDNVLITSSTSDSKVAGNITINPTMPSFGDRQNDMPQDTLSN